MKTSGLMLVSIFISIAILVIIGGVVTTVRANRLASQATVQEDLQAYQQREEEFIQREEQYRQIIDQANQQIEKANANLQALQSQAPAAQEDVQVSSSESSYISVGQASDIAQQAAGADMLALKDPELVNYEGQAAYEISFEGGLVYIDALTGAVLMNGTAAPVVDQEMAIQIASDYFSEKDVVLADQITFHGEPLFRVVFKSSLMVYIDQAGQIVYAQYATIASQADNSENYSSDGGGSSSNSSYENEHEDEHEYEHEGD